MKLKKMSELNIDIESGSANDRAHEISLAENRRQYQEFHGKTLLMSMFKALIE